MKLTKELANYKLGLIQVPYSLEIIKKSDVFSDIHIYEERLITSFKNIFFKPKKIKNIFQKVDNTLFINKTDILFVHTDMDLLNQYIIQKFYQCGARVYLLEDGIATITQFNMNEDRADFKDSLRCILLKYIYNFKYLKIIKYGVLTQPVMEDFIFNGVIVNYGDTIQRKIPLYKLSANQKQINVLHEDEAIFFNQPLYLFYLSEDEFVNFIEEVLYTSYNFSLFYFKFHPSDNESFIVKVSDLINRKFKNVRIVTENIIAEEIIYKYPVKYAITISSTSAFNLMNKGVIPIYLNDILNSRHPNEAFNAFSKFLESINCHTPKNMEEVKSNFVAFAKKNTIEDGVSLTDIIELK